MNGILKPDLCVIGAGSGGLSVAAGAVQMGASVVLIEGHKMGGDCLNYGCVPSKALLAAAKAAQGHRSSAPFGIAAHEPEVDFPAVMDHVHSVIRGIEPHDSVERFEGLGVTVIQDWAKFTGPRTVRAGDKTIEPRRFVIATGSSPVVPPIPGLDSVPFLTNENLWQNRELPERLIIIGGGAIGLEMAQAHRRLGASVVVLEAFKVLGQNDPELTGIALEALRGEGIEILEDAKAVEVSGVAGEISVTLENDEKISGSHLLVATGRSPSIGKLDLDAAGIAHNERGITVDTGLRSVTNRKVYAIGDVAGGLQFTHVAGYQAGLVIRSALFRLPVKNRTDMIPWVTYTDPEIAQVGLSEAAARAEFGDSVEVATFNYAENDRARTELRTEGKIKAIVGRRGKILGCSIVGAQAGEIIQLWAFAISKGLKIGDMAGQVAAYPTLAELSKRAAGAYFAPRLFQSDRVKMIVRLLARLG